MGKKFEASKLEFNTNIIGNLDSTIKQGIKVMDALQSIDIKEATFTNGNYFKVDKTSRTIVSKKIMLTETKTDFMVLVSKNGHTIEESINTDITQPSQKMIGAYTGISQSSVSKKKNK